MDEERTSYQVNHLAQLESEAIFILRETAAEFLQENKLQEPWIRRIDCCFFSA